MQLLRYLLMKVNLLLHAKAAGAVAAHKRHDAASVAVDSGDAVAAAVNSGAGCHDADTIAVDGDDAVACSSQGAAAAGAHARSDPAAATARSGHDLLLGGRTAAGSQQVPGGACATGDANRQGPQQIDEPLCELARSLNELQMSALEVIHALPMVHSVDAQ